MKTTLNNIKIIILISAVGTISSCSNDDNVDNEKQINEYVQTGISFVQDDEIVGYKLAEAWCEQIKKKNISVDILKFNPTLGKPSYQTLFDNIKKDYLGNDYTETKKTLSYIYTKTNGSIEKTVVKGIEHGEIMCFESGGSNTSNGVSVTYDDLFNKIKKLIEKYPEFGNTGDYFVSSFSVEESADSSNKTPKETGYSIVINKLHNKYPVYDFASAITKGSFQFDVNGEITYFSFTPGKIVKADEYAGGKILAYNEALKKAKDKLDISNISNYNISCGFSYETAANRNGDIYFVPVYDFTFDSKTDEDDSVDTTIVATKDSRALTELDIDRFAEPVIPDKK